MTIEVAQYDPSLTYPGQKQFDCGHDAINAFVRGSLKQQVKRSLSAAYVLLDPTKDDTFVGFYTIASHMIPVTALSAIQTGGLPKQIPCTRLIMLGIATAYKGQHLGQRLMKHALQLTKRSAPHIGSYGMYLDADAGAFGFYEKLGFTPLDGDLSPDPSPMFLRISDIP
jgi:ribosomal protein S18 acetylase RimI-like enzyme